MACLWILSVFACGCEVLGSGSCVSIVEQEREPYSVVSLSQLTAANSVGCKQAIVNTHFGSSLLMATHTLIRLDGVCKGEEGQAPISILGRGGYVKGPNCG